MLKNSLLEIHLEVYQEDKVAALYNSMLEVIAKTSMLKELLLQDKINIELYQ